jgi:hypothetical protein
VCSLYPTALDLAQQANASSFTILPSRSGVMRTWDQRIVLDVSAERWQLWCCDTAVRSHVDGMHIICGLSPAKACCALQVFTEHMVTLSLSGYMFFGSALAVSDRVLHVRLLAHPALAARCCLVPSFIVAQ